MADREPTEPELTHVAAVSGKHLDTVRRYAEGLNVYSTTKLVIEAASRDFGYTHIIETRERALAAKDD